MSKVETVRAPRGTEITCKSWLTEAPMRMLMNNLDPEVAERPEDLVVYGGTGKAARNWESFHAIVRTLKELELDETLLVQSGKPVGVFKTTPDAPRVIIANSLLVPKWATWEHFNELDKKGLMMYGQMTAGSWIYIGTQGILQGTYETFMACAKKDFKSDSLKGKFILTAGLGGMSGAQPLAITMGEGVGLIVEVDPARIQRRLDHKFLMDATDDLDDAIDRVQNAVKSGKPLSIGLEGNAADVFPELVRRGIYPDIVTDQTSAHDALNGYVPNGMRYADALKLRETNPDKYIKESMRAMSDHCAAIIDMQKGGSVCFDYGNNLRGQALEAGLKNAFDYPGFVPAYIRPLFCEGKGPFRWAALSGEPKDIEVTDNAIRSLFPHDKALIRWIDMASKRVKFQGLPARICWLGMGDRMKAGLEFNRLVREGIISAPIVIGRDHLDAGSVASPNRETEGMLDGSDAVADWPVLNALLNAVSGATWVSVHHGGGVGIGYSIHAGMVICCDGTSDADRRLERVLTNDPATGIMRHVDAGYELAIENAKKHGIKIPMMEK